MAAASVLVNCIACSLLARYTQSSTNNVPHAAVTKAGYKTAARLSYAVITCLVLMEITSVFGLVLCQTVRLVFGLQLLGSRQNAYSISVIGLIVCGAIIWKKKPELSWVMITH